MSYDYDTTLKLISLFVVDLCAEITCNVASEVCVEGVCKCGNANSCENKATGAFCDASNNVCKCAQDVDACNAGEGCTDGACGMKINNNTY